MNSEAARPQLDGEELLHLAIEASRMQRHGDAIRYLKEAAVKGPSNARVHYLLGAEHAQIGLYERAGEDMTTALKLDPSLAPARFQLGLLYLARGKIADASSVWKPLDALGDANPYMHFKRGLEYLASDDFPNCQASLSRGIALNVSNPALNQDMQRVLDAASAARGKAAPAQQTPESETTGQSGHILLSAYARARH